MKSNWPAVTVVDCNDAGPRLAPKIVITSPGATCPAAKLAPFTTPDAENVGGPCNSVNVSPAMAMVPVRESTVLPAKNVTTPVPIPFAPDWIVVHGTVLVASHG